MKKSRTIYQALIYSIITIGLIFIQIDDKNNIAEANLMLARNAEPVEATKEVKEPYIDFEIIYESIPYETELVYNSNVLEGTNNLLQEGIEGKRKTIYKEIYTKQGLLADKELKTDEVYIEPVNEIVEVGTKIPYQTITTSRGTERYKKSMVFTATAYDLSYESCGKNPGDKYYGLTYSGTQARPGVVAVDPNVIPLGTKMYIESLDGWPDYGYAVAEDIGGAIKGNRIDLFMSDRQTALNFGMRNVKIYILE